LSDKEDSLNEHVLQPVNASDPTQPLDRPGDLCARALVRLDRMAGVRNFEPSEYSKLLRALLVERQALINSRTVYPDDERLKPTDAALREFAGGPARR
jgi:hypothetical protein